MKSFYKHEAESILGKGTVYFEFNGIYASRQVEVYNNKWFCSNRDYHPELKGLALCDQPLSELDLSPQNKILSDEFEDVWNKALKKTRSSRLK